MIVAVSFLDIAHPPGYPLFALIGRLFSLIPLGDVAMRLNLMAVFFAAMSCWLLARLGAPYVGFRLATISSLILAASLSFWHEANIARVYSLNTFLMLLGLILLRRFEVTKAPKWLGLFALLFGLGLGNHLSLLILAGPLILILWAHRPGSTHTPPIRWREFFTWIALGLAFFLIGLSIFVYLPIRSHQHLVQNFGTPNTLLHFWRVISREEYWQKQYAQSIWDGLDIGIKFFRSIGREFSSGLAGLILLGAIIGWRREPHLTRRLLILIGLNFLLVALHGSDYDLNYTHRYYIPAYLAMTLFLPFTLGALDTALKKWLPANLVRRPWCQALPWLFGLMLWLSLLGRNFALNDRSQDFFPRDYGINILNSLEAERTLIADGDNEVTILSYLYYIEKYRDDIKLIVGPFLETAWYRERFPRSDFESIDPRLFRHQFQAAIPFRDIYILNHLIKYASQSISVTSNTLRVLADVKDLHLVPQGLTYKFRAAAYIEERPDAELHADTLMRPFKTAPDETIRAADLLVQNIFERVALYYNRIGGALLEKKKDIRAAEALLDQALAWKGDESAIYVNLGIARILSRDLRQARRFLTKAIELEQSNPLAYLNLGLLEQMERHYSAARQAYQVAKKWTFRDPALLRKIQQAEKLLDETSR